MSSAETTTAVDKSGSRVRRMFGEIAGRYDLLNRVLSLGVDVYWRWRTVRTIAPAGGAPILDVCTGTGDLALAYRRRADASAVVVGSDFTHEMLVRARLKAMAMGGPAPVTRPAREAPRDEGTRGQEDQENARSGRIDEAPVSFIEADAQSLPFPDDTFQIVSVAFGLRNVADTRRGLGEMIRVCQPGGRVAVLEFSQPTNRLFGAIYRFYFRQVLPRVGQWISGSRMDAYHYLPESVGEFPCGAALARMMSDCGLAEVVFRPLTFGIATLYWGRKPAPALTRERAA